MSRASSLALAFNLPSLFSSSPPFFFRLHLDSLSSPNSPSQHTVSEFNSSPPACPPPSPTVSPPFVFCQVPSSPSQGSAFSHSLSVVRKKRMQRRRGGSGRGDGGRSSSGSRLPLPAREEADVQPSANNVASFIFRSELNRPRVMATITIAFQEEAIEEVGQSSGARKRQRKSTISDKPSQLARKETALPVKNGTKTSDSNGSSSPTSGSDGYGREDTALKSSHSPSSSDFSAHNSKEKASDLDEGYSCPIVEENPPRKDS